MPARPAFPAEHLTDLLGKSSPDGRPSAKPLVGRVVFALDLAHLDRPGPNLFLKPKGIRIQMPDTT